MNAAVRNAAITWQLRLAVGNASDTDYQAFAAWIAEDAAHAAAFSHVETLAGKIDGLRAEQSDAFDHLLDLGQDRLGRDRFDQDQDRSKPANDNRFSARAAIAASMAAVIITAAAIFGYQNVFPNAEYIAIAAQPDQFRTAHLSDGTVITLAPGAKFEATLTRESRAVTSLSGVTYFDVASDRDRPFTIDLGAQSVSVVGTQFEITAFPDRRSVSVAEGIVTIQTGDDATGVTRLTLGDKLTYSGTHPEGQRETAPPASIGDWRAGFFEFENADARQVATRLNSFYGREAFALDPNNPPAISFSGVLTLSDPAGTAQRLSELAPIEFETVESRYFLSAAPKETD